MNKAVFVISLFIIAAVGYLAWDLGQERAQSPAVPAAQAPAQPAPASAPKAPSSIRYPIGATPVPTGVPLPSLEESDQAIAAALARLLGVKALPAFFHPRHLIARFVVTVDNLPRSKAPTRMMPVAPVGGHFLVIGAGRHLMMDAANATRYRIYLNVMERVNTKQLVDLYVHFYPLFQQAYEELGYPKGYFNDRLMDAIDDMLAAPAVSQPVALVQPNVLYLFADPKIEALSAGRKIMIRMGKENAARARFILNSIRSELIRRTSVTPVPQGQSPIK